MAFWNRKRKKKLTTAKPKINASVPKPKVNSEKQESSIPPQPKKMDIPKPDKLPKNENVRKEFLKAFHQLRYGPKANLEEHGILEYRAEVEDGFIVCEEE